MPLDDMDYRSAKLTSTYLWRGDVNNRPAEEDRLGKGNLEWTLNKLLLGAGAGADPTEIDVPGGKLVEIGDTLLAAPAASVSFAGIAAGYAFFLLFWDEVYGDNAGWQLLQMTFNADGGANYDYYRGGFNQPTVTVHNTNFILIGTCGSVGTNDARSHGISIIHNRATIQKAVHGFDLSELRSNVGGSLNDVTHLHDEGKWRNVVNEISTITITPSVGNLVAGSRFILLGVST